MTPKTETLYHCRQCGRSNFISRVAHKIPPGGSQAPKCRGDFVAQSLTPCWTCNFQSNRACPDPGIITHSPWQGCNAWFRKPAADLPAVPSAIAHVPSLPAKAPKAFTFKKGDPDQIAADFKDAFAKTERAAKVVVAFGVLATHVKKNLLRHGQFGDWVAAQCGENAYRSVRGYMQFAGNVMEKSGVRSLEAFVAKWQDLPICHRGEFLLLPDNEVPNPVREIRKKALDLMENKTVNQLFFEFKQAEDDESGNPKVKRGRLKGHGGASHAQREAAQQQEEKDRLETLDLKADTTADWLMQVSDDQGLGCMSQEPRAKLRKAMETALGYLRNAVKS